MSELHKRICERTTLETCSAKSLYTFDVVSFNSSLNALSVILKRPHIFLVASSGWHEQKYGVSHWWELVGNCRQWTMTYIGRIDHCQHYNCHVAKRIVWTMLKCIKPDLMPTTAIVTWHTRQSLRFLMMRLQPFCLYFAVKFCSALTLNKWQKPL